MEQSRFDERGKLVGFHGLPVAHSRDKPPGMERYEEHRRSDLLPFGAYLRGWELIELYPSRYSYSADPFVLYDRWGHILYRWPDNYEPGWMEVKDICEQLVRGEA